MPMQEHRRVILMETANMRVKELAERLITGEIEPALRTLDLLGSGQIRLFDSPDEHHHHFQPARTMRCTLCGEDLDKEPT